MTFGNLMLNLSQVWRKLQPAKALTDFLALLHFVITYVIL